MDQFEKIENQLLSSYESILAEESRKICKEVDSLFQYDEKFNNIEIENYCSNCLLFGKDLFDIIKAKSYLSFFVLRKDFIDNNMILI